MKCGRDWACHQLPLLIMAVMAVMSWFLIARPQSRRGPGRGGKSAGCLDGFGVFTRGIAIVNFVVDVLLAT